MNEQRLLSEAGLDGHFPEREKQGMFSRSLQGRIYGGPENAHPIRPPTTSTPTVHE